MTGFNESMNDDGFRGFLLGTVPTGMQVHSMLDSRRSDGAKLKRSTVRGPTTRGRIICAKDTTIEAKLR